MSELLRFSVSVEEELLENYDTLIRTQGYANRSEAMRDLMRDALVRAKLENASDTDEVVGSLTLVYDHHARELNDKMNDIQHQYHNLVVSVMHVHINHDDCLEVIVLRGALKDVRLVAESLLSLKGVKHGKLFVTLPAGKIIESTSHSHAHTHPH